MIDIPTWLRPDRIDQARDLAVDIEVSVLCHALDFCRS
jgi:hypothetical protein